MKTFGLTGRLPPKSETTPHGLKSSALVKNVKGMEKNVRKGNTKTKGKRVSIYLNPESLEWFRKIQKDWHLEGKDSKTVQTILNLWKLFQTSLDHSDELIKIITALSSLNEKRRREVTKRNE
jgi:hypothetical protein